MQVILKKDIPQLGRIGELVKVREGYARNYLLPRALAVPANTGNLKVLEHQKRVVEALKKKVQKESGEAAKRIQGTEIRIERRFNEAGKMYGTLTAADISAELKKNEVVVDRRDIEMTTIKAPGDYDIKVRLPGDVYADIKLILSAFEEKPKAIEKKAKGRATKTKAPKTKASTRSKKQTEED